MKPFSLCTGALILSVVACSDKHDSRGDSSAESSASAKGGKGKSGGAGQAGVGPRSVLKLAAGDGAACAIMDNGTVRCWGKNDGGERGSAKSTDDAATPVEVPGIVGAVDIVMGGDSGSSGDIACVTAKDGVVSCWGGAQMLPLKDGKTEPRAVPELKGALSIALGGGTGYAVKPDGTVWGWGSPAFNSLADGSESGSDKPLTAIPGLSGAKQVAAGQNHACALLADGTVSCWGYVSKKQKPTAVAGVSGATSIFADSQRDETCAITKDATLCWTDNSEAKAREELKSVSKLAGRNHKCALGADGSVTCWGSDNAFGQVGHGDPSSKPGKVDGLTQKAVDIAVGHVFACAALVDGSAVCWGYNQRGQLGDGTLMDRKVATPVVGITNEKLEAAGTGSDAVQEGSATTSWDGLPAKCKNGPLAVVSKEYDGKSFVIKAARATSQLDGKTISIELADHNFHTSWGKPRAKQGKLAMRLARFDLKDKKREPVAVDLGEYKLGYEEERVVSPTLETKLGTKNLISISLQGVDAGKLTLSHLDDKWVCGELAISANGQSVTGPFAAPLKK